MRFDDFKAEGSENAVKVRIDLINSRFLFLMNFQYRLCFFLVGRRKIQTTRKNVRGARWRYNFLQIQRRSWA